MEIRENVQLAPFTTLHIGGPTRFFVRAEREEDVLEAVEHASAHSLPLFVLGGGSNILVSDAGFDGLVIQIAIKGLQSTYAGSKVILNAGAGEDWDNFVELCVSRGLGGVECLSGIPGFVGGTPVQNVGAYGQDVSETIHNVRCLERKTGNIVDLANEDCGFSYRRSIFNSTQGDRFVVLSVTFVLRTDGQPKIAYKDISDLFLGRSPTLTEVREAVLRIRRAKSMVIDATDENRRSAGSFFKNPVVDRPVLDKIAEEFDSVPHFDAGDKVKIPAAWLIEKAGFEKGFRLGKAGISKNHTLALINCGGATAAEIIALRSLVQNGVSKRFGIDLEQEPILVGF